ncbi:hypothetical protein KY347_06970 [Candidatus Woesearchaeota archaeon]|nr:hypothetical protein [Candidatus Woesearchaeota archaeon]
MSIEELEVLKGEKHREKVFGLLQDPKTIQTLDERIIEHLLVWKECYGIADYMSNLIRYGKKDVSEKAFGSIHQIGNNKSEASVYAQLLYHEENRFKGGILKALRSAEDDTLKYQVILSCAIDTGDVDILDLYALIKDKESRLNLLKEINSCVFRGERYDTLRDRARECYLKETSVAKPS